MSTFTTKAGETIEYTEVPASDIKVGDSIIAYGAAREVGSVTVFNDPRDHGRYADGNIRFRAADNGAFLANGAKPTKMYRKVER